MINSFQKNKIDKMFYQLRYSINRLHKFLFIIIYFLSTSALLLAQSESQKEINSQKDRLMQYAGVWSSSINPDTDSVAEFPQIKMICEKKLNGTALSVEVFQKKNNEYQTILYEMICYDPSNDSISAYGQNQRGEIFLGAGLFSDDKNWEMVDRNLKGQFIMSVRFLFNDCTDVTVEGFDKQNKSLWKTRYIKQNP
jgi:hypothetical protein